MKMLKRTPEEDMIVKKGDRESNSEEAITEEGRVMTKLSKKEKYLVMGFLVLQV